jgi:hypothetical protein
MPRLLLAREGRGSIRNLMAPRNGRKRRSIEDRDNGSKKEIFS